MAFLLFVDESGNDHRQSPYEVLAGIAVADRDLWNLIRAVQSAEEQFFGRRYSAGPRELKGRKLLKRKVFRHATQDPAIDPVERAALAAECLNKGESADRQQLTALAQSKIEYVKEVLQLCGRFRCRVFASIVSDPSNLPVEEELLRRDYVYLFERFYYFLDERASDQTGIIIFDELERTQSHLLIGQMESYFKRTAKGRQRANLILPEPMFVHSDLTTAVQIADMVAYIISWGFRTGPLRADARPELEEFVELIKPLRFRTEREIEGEMREIWSIVIV